MSKTRILYNERIQESVKLHALAAGDPLVPETIRKAMAASDAGHVVVLDIDAKDAVAMHLYHHLKENYRVKTHALLLGEQPSGNHLKVFLLPQQESIMALEETGIYEPSSGKSAKIRSALAALLSENETDPTPRHAHRR